MRDAGVLGRCSQLPSAHFRESDEWITDVSTRSADHFVFPSLNALMNTPVDVEQKRKGLCHPAER